MEISNQVQKNGRDDSGGVVELPRMLFGTTTDETFIPAFSFDSKAASFKGMSILSLIDKQLCIQSCWGTGLLFKSLCWCWQRLSICVSSSQKRYGPEFD